MARSFREQPETGWPTGLPRPIHLLEMPERIEVAAPIPDYPPMHFRHRNELHKIVQVSMGWEDRHAWAFFIGGEEYGDDVIDAGGDREFASARRAKPVRAERSNAITAAERKMQMHSTVRLRNPIEIPARRSSPLGPFE